MSKNCIKISISLLVLLFQSCSSNNKKINKTFVIEETSKQKSKLLIINKIINNKKRDSRYFEIINGIILEKNYFFDGIHNLNDSIHINLNHIEYRRVINFSDSTNLQIGPPNCENWEYFIEKKDNLEFIFIKRGVAENLKYEYFLFDKNQKLIDVYF